MIRIGVGGLLGKLNLGEMMSNSYKSKIIGGDEKQMDLGLVREGLGFL